MLHNFYVSIQGPLMVLGAGTLFIGVVVIVALACGSLLLHLTDDRHGR